MARSNGLLGHPDSAEQQIADLLAQFPTEALASRAIALGLSRFDTALRVLVAAEAWTEACQLVEERMRKSIDLEGEMTKKFSYDCNQVRTITLNLLHLYRMTTEDTV